MAERGSGEGGGVAARPSRGRRAAALVLGVVAALVLAEALLRVTGAGAYELRFAAYPMTGDPSRGWWELDPAHPPEHRWDGDPHGCLPPGARMTYELGEGGLRGPLPAPGRPAVLVVGDSFTFGEGVRAEDTFCARLERALADEPPAPAFVNAGVPGYATVEEAARLPSLLDRFRPEAVLAVFVPNDAVPLEETFDVPDLVNAKSREDSPLRLLSVARAVLGRASRDRAVEDWYLSYYAGERSFRWREARAALGRMRDAARARGATFGVALFPLLHRLAERPLAPIHDAARDACADLGVPFLDLTPALAAAGERELWVHPTDHHPNARGHELAAGALRPFVEDLLHR